MSVHFGGKRNREEWPAETRKEVGRLEQELAQLPGFLRDTTWLESVARAKEAAMTFHWSDRMEELVGYDADDMIYEWLDVHTQTTRSTRETAWFQAEVKERTNRFLSQVFADGEFIEDKTVEEQGLRAFRVFQTLIGNRPWMYLLPGGEEVGKFKSNSWVFENLMRDVSTPETRGTARPLARPPVCAVGRNLGKWTLQVEKLLEDEKDPFDLQADDLHFLICDDAIYSGTQLWETVTGMHKEFEGRANSFVVNADGSERFTSPNIRRWVQEHRGVLHFYVVSACACDDFQNSSHWMASKWGSSYYRKTATARVDRTKHFPAALSDVAMRVDYAVTVLYGHSIKTISESKAAPFAQAALQTMAGPPPADPRLTGLLAPCVTKLVRDVLGKAVGNAVLQHKIPDGVSYPEVFDAFLRLQPSFKAYLELNEKPYARAARGTFPVMPHPLAERFDCAAEGDENDVLPRPSARNS